MAESGHWARSLRTIGQEIAGFAPVFLAIEMRGDVFVVRGTYFVRARNPRPGGVRKFLKFLLELSEKNPEEDASQPPLESFEFRYTGQDLDRLNEDRATRREKTNKNPDLYNIPELLRTVGRQIDSEGGHLLKITKEDRTLIVRFRDGAGNVKAQECSLLALYKKQKDMISKRGTSEITDMWEFYDL